MTDSRRLLWAIGFIALAACGGTASQDRPKDTDDSASASGAPGTLAPSGSSGAPCCNLIRACNPGDRTLDDSLCPTEGSCYSLEGCCGLRTYCAYVEPPPAGPPAMSDACPFLGSWHAHSAPWNGKSADTGITFLSDGTLMGAGPFTGTWSLTGSTLTIQDTVGPDMDCSFADSWQLTFSADCQTAPLVPIGGGCTGSRRYLDWNVTLTREVVK